MPLSMLFKQNDCIPIEFRSVDCDSPFIRLYNSYVDDQQPKYEIVQKADGKTVTLNEKYLSPNDIRLSFEIDHERNQRYLLIEIHSRFISQRVPLSSGDNIYSAKAEYDEEVLKVHNPKA